MGTLDVLAFPRPLSLRPARQQLCALYLNEYIIIIVIILDRETPTQSGTVYENCKTNRTSDFSNTHAWVD
jgi:hypothetical protein